MPRKTKDQLHVENEKVKNNKLSKKNISSKDKTSTSTKKTSKTSSISKTKRNTANSKAKSISSSKNVSGKRSNVVNSSSNNRKKVLKHDNSKQIRKSKSLKNVNSKKDISNKSELLEYYDLPYRYNQTLVKVLAQTPTTLFIYWDISDDDRELFKKQYGDNFFETTKPVLIVYNNTLNYKFEIDINDFANSWYLHVADSKCDYKIELGRRPIVKNEKISTDYIYISTSNEIESPNDRVLFNKQQNMVYFRNVKNGQVHSKPINTLSFIRNVGKIYNIYDIYKAMYNADENENIEEFFDFSNPSSGNPSSR